MKKRTIIIFSFSIWALLLYALLWWVTGMMSALDKGRAYDLAEAYQAVIEKAYNWNEVFASHGMILNKISCPSSTRGRYMMLHVVLAEMPKGDADLPTELEEFIASHADLTGGRVMKVTMHAPSTPEQKASEYLRDKTLIYGKNFFLVAFTISLHPVNQNDNTPGIYPHFSRA